MSHIGDSRAYHFRHNRLRQLTRDDTVAQELIEAGVPADDVARFSHVLTHSLGGDACAWTEDLSLSLQAGDRLLLCTDGLSSYVPEADMSEVLRSHPEPQAACDALIQCALDQGGKDNVTVIVCDVLDAAPEHAETSEYVV